jgi:amidase
MPAPSDDDIAYASLVELRSRGATSVTLVEHLLDRIATLDAPGTPTALRSVLAVSPTALDDARAADAAAAAGGGGGPLQGVPVLVKDNIEVAGLPSAAGASALAGRPAVRDAPLVGRLRNAGAVVLGSANLSQWANIRDSRSSSGWSALGGLTSNPWALDRSAGGSSSGSGAAVAAGLAPLAIGTETDGSIVCPAALNGIAGIKPAVGAVSTAGVVPLSASQDSPGPMARTVADVAVLLEVLTGWSGVADRVGAGIRGVRIAVVRSWPTGHGPTDDAFETAVGRLASAGAVLHDVEPARPPAWVRADEHMVLLCELADGLARYLPTRGPGGPQDLAGVVAHETAAAATELVHFGHDLFEQALGLGGCDTDIYRSARRRCLDWSVRTCLGPIVDGADLLVSPAYGPAWKIDLVLGDQLGVETAASAAPAMAGWPIATAPVATVGGLPVGLAAVGRPGSEALLLAACAAVERPERPGWRPPTRG